MNEPIRFLPHRFDVEAAVEELERSNGWNAYSPRRDAYAHKEIDDFWVRYNPWRNFHGDMSAFNAEHESEWYPEARDIPSVRSLVFDVMRAVEGERLGGVLITRIPPGGQVKPHFDSGWHATYYQKFAVQLQGNAAQAFCFEGARLSARPGDMYTFDNSRLHWVTNESDAPRMTLIVCIRGARYGL